MHRIFSVECEQMLIEAQIMCVFCCLYAIAEQQQQQRYFFACSSSTFRLCLCSICFFFQAVDIPVPFSRFHICGHTYSYPFYGIVQDHKKRFDKCAIQSILSSKERSLMFGAIVILANRGVAEREGGRKAVTETQEGGEGEFECKET